MESINILHVFRAPVGGLFRHALDLARAQIARRHRVGIIADSNTGGVRAEEVLHQLKPELALGLSRFPMLRHANLRDLSALNHVRRRVAETGADVIHGHGAKGGAYARLVTDRRRAVRAYTAPPIVFDTTFKVFRGGATIIGAVCDILVTRQTSALAELDGHTLVRATLLAAALCAIPASIACAILLLSADRLFAFLLGPAATMPPETTPILIVLLIANLTQMITHSVLVHNGYFKDVARLGICVSAAMTAVAGVAIIGHLDIVRFLEGYTAVYACGALAAVVLMIAARSSLPTASVPLPRLRRDRRLTYSPRRSGRGAARLAHQSGGLGVVGSNPAAPTST
jgi:Glycosyltransferase Family 4